MQVRAGSGDWKLKGGNWWTNGEKYSIVSQFTKPKRDLAGRLYLTEVG